MAVERDELLPKQAAREIGMSVQWLYIKLRQGKGPPYRRRGRLILIRREDLIKWNSQPVI